VEVVSLGEEHQANFGHEANATRGLSEGDASRGRRALA
jgi:hypothetical protein